MSRTRINSNAWPAKENFAPGFNRLMNDSSIVPSIGPRSTRTAIALSLVIVYGSILEAVSSYQKMEYQYGTLPFPLWPIKAIVAFGFLVLVIQQAVQLLRMFAVMSGRVRATDEARIHAERSI